jgi:DNA gyrase subunit A
MGRAAGGVRGMGLRSGDAVVGMEILEAGATILTVTENGYGKRTPLEDYRSRTAAARASSRSGPPRGTGTWWA